MSPFLPAHTPCPQWAVDYVAPGSHVTESLGSIAGREEAGFPVWVRALVAGSTGAGCCPGKRGRRNECLGCTCAENSLGDPEL